LAVVTNTVSIFINPAPNPTITSSNGASICAGGSTVLTASNSGTLTTTYVWNPGAHANPYTVSPSTGTQIYTVAVTNTCGTTNATYTVTTNPLPAITVAPDSVCLNGNATLTATGANTYTWNTGVNTVSISQSNVTANATYTVTGTNTLTSCQNTGVGHIIIRTAPTIITNSISICEGVQSVLTASGGSSNSYTWSPGGPSGNATYSVTPSNTTSIIVTGADAHGCVNTNTVTVNPEPVFTMANGGICPGAQAVLTPNPSSGSATTYSWVPLNVTTTNTAPSVTVQPASTTNYTVISTNSSGCSYTQTASVAVNSTLTINPPTNTLVCSGVTNTLTVSGASSYSWLASAGTVTPVIPGDFSSVSANQTGNVTYTVSGTSGSCSTSTTFTIDVAPAFTVTAVASPSASVCPGATLSLSASPAAAYIYTWSDGINDGVSFTPAATHVYTLTATDANGCTANATENVTVYASPTVTVNSPAVCSGSTTTLTASGATTYTWSATTSGGNTNTTTAMPTVSPQTYTVMGMDVNGCMSATVTSTVTTNSLPVISVNANPANATTCAGGSITLSGSGANTYTWSGGINDGVSFNPASSQQYTVNGTDANGCKGTATQSVTVNALPTVTVTSSAVCLGNSTTLQSGGPSVVTYTWSTAAQTANITVQPTTAGITTYTIAVTDINNCSNAAVATLTTNPLPNITINATSTSVCSGSSATLTASSTSTLTYDWNNTGSNTNPIVVSPVNPSNTYTAVGTDANNCEASQTVVITVNAAPVSQTISGNTFVCKGYMASPTVLSAPNPGYWTGPAPSTATVSANSTTANITKGGVYTLHTVNGCGDATSTFTVTADSVVAGFTANPTNGQTPVTVSYTNTSTAMTGNTLTYLWSFGNGASSGSINPTEVFTGVGTFQTLLIATDNNSCKDTASIYITVSDVPTVIVIPNVFSPNGDNINDQFFIKGTGISNLECRVYDRWGLLLHQWEGLDGYWDGRAKNGSNCTDGTYFYLITYSDNQGKSYTKDGFLQLLK
jgi:gliding motility-associated-like protein